MFVRFFFLGKKTHFGVRCFFSHSNNMLLSFDLRCHGHMVTLSPSVYFLGGNTSHFNTSPLVDRWVDCGLGLTFCVFRPQEAFLKVYEHRTCHRHAQSKFSQETRCSFCRPLNSCEFSFTSFTSSNHALIPASCRPFKLEVFPAQTSAVHPPHCFAGIEFRY